MVETPLTERLKFRVTEHDQGKVVVQAEDARKLERDRARLVELLREGLMLQSRWPEDGELYPDEFEWCAKVNAALASLEEK